MKRILFLAAALFLSLGAVSYGDGLLAPCAGVFCNGPSSLTSNLPVIGNGSGAPTTGTRSGSTTVFGTTSGTLTNGHCVSIDGSGNLVDAGGACTTGGGGGTVSSGTAGQMTYYASTGTTVSGNANATISAGALTLGQASSVLGQLKLSGSTSGTTTLTPAVAASGTLTLPAATDTLVGQATTDTLTNKTISGSSNTLSNIGNSSLTNSSMTIAGHVIALGGTQTLAASDLTNGTTGSGSVVLATSPTLVTPTLGVASATTINKVTLTAPATGSTLTILNNKTLTANNSITLAGTDSTVMTFPTTSKTIAANDLSNVTLSGDCTNSSAVVTCTKTSGTSFGPYATALLGQLPGDNTGTPASAGNIGQVLHQHVGTTTVSLTSNTATNVATVSLTAGNWIVWGIVKAVPAASTTMPSNFFGWTSTVSATLGSFTDEGFTGNQNAKVTGQSQALTVPAQFISVASTTSVYLEIYLTFSVSTATAGGDIYALRVN